MSNTRLKEFISDWIYTRLDVGAKKYGEELDVKDGRDWLKEAIEEVLDLTVYLSAKLILIKEKENEHQSPVRKGKEKGKEVEQKINGAECEEISRRPRNKIVTKEGWTYTGEGSSRGHKYFVGETMACGGDDGEE